MLRPCKAAIDCTGTDQEIKFTVIRFKSRSVIDGTGYLYELDKTRDLIIAQMITDVDAIEAFIVTNQAREMRWREWKAGSGTKAAFITMNQTNAAEYIAWQRQYIDFGDPPPVT